jgi:acyl-CoA synthetase (AMP-forming)/AMP-acid ligase II/acetyltransferase-like isoleucine patch superfamily enzyme/acyl carrier protein
LKTWSRTWKEQRALGALIDAELQFESLLDLLPGAACETPAIASIDPGRDSLTFSALLDFVRDRGRLDAFGLKPGDRCAIALTEGPELAVCLLAISTRCVAAPMNPWSPAGEITADLMATGAKAVIVQAGDDFDPVRRAARACGVAVIDLAPRSQMIGLFDLTGKRSGAAGTAPYNAADDIALTIFTSGTSGRKKLVKIRLKDLCVGAAALAAALELGPEDLGYNMMPLFHVGGIVRNLFAPLIAGSGMIYSPGYDPEMFWEVLERGANFNWYYASPTMHEGILQKGCTRPQSRHRLRFICNAAGDLLPSTAERLRERFGGAAVLPGYGMTECMPIACPPLDYRLERKGASGRILGPQVSIRDEAGAALPTGSTGRILIRGVPVARLEANDVNSIDAAAADGWFDTGDIGRFDEDGFLYVVGRSKDIIKRGGETIAPAEIEEVLVGHPDIGAALAFAVPHPTLGEAVGAVIVPRGSRRVAFEGLSAHLSQHLIPSKWPVILVYSEDLPKNVAGKLLRAGLAARLGIKGVDEKSAMRSRLFEAVCPAPGAASGTAITSRAVVIDPVAIEAAIRACCAGRPEIYVRVDDSCGAIRVAVETHDLDRETLSARLHALSHDYLMPTALAVLSRFPRDPASGEIDFNQLSALLDEPDDVPGEPIDEIESFILQEWRACLDAPRALHLDSDYFDDLAGDSLTAVRIIANIRKRYSIALAPTSIFRSRTIRRLAVAVRSAFAANSASAGNLRSIEAAAPKEGPTAKPQTSFTTLITQLLPVAVLAPMLRLGQLFCWLLTLWYMRSELDLTGFWVTPAALAVAHVIRQTLTPLAAIALKWLIVGRYRAGKSPLWGHGYLRWWLVRQFQRAAGLGTFASSYALTTLYFRLLGAKVGARTRIAPTADLGEFDLLTIGEDVCIEEYAIVRPFALEGGSMALKPIAIGANCSLGIRATVVPGTTLPADTDIAPMASSNEANGRNVGTRALCRPLIFDPPASLQVLGLLIRGAVVFLAWAPIFFMVHRLLAGLMPMHGAGVSPQDLIFHMMRPERLLAYWEVLIASTLLSPFLYLAGVILVKWTVIGRFRAGVDSTKPWPMFERWLMWQLLPDGHFGDAGPLLGANFAGISVIYRLLGSKVGKRVYWPGSGNVLVEYDLFSCGDDVTFGSRSTFLMSSARGSKPIHIESGANVADRCVLAPGVEVKRNAVLGSGTFAPEDFVAPAGSTWIGHGGRASPIELEEASPRKAEEATIRPYGLAMYEGKANYPVWPLGAHIAFNLSSAAFVATYHALPIMGTWALMHATSASLGSLADNGVALTLILCGLFLPLHLASVAGALGLLIGTKWLIIGRRVPGEHHWHRSSYCQRWKIHHVIASITSRWTGSRDLLSLFEGSVYLVWIFRALGAQIGENVCLYPNGADPLMEEPDFLKIGDHARIDQAVLIAHLNTRGEWMMGPIEIGAEACLRSMSRVMMISTVGDRSTLLERTLVLAGDSSQPGAIWHGWPGEEVTAKQIADLQRHLPAADAPSPSLGLSSIQFITE